MPQEGWLFKKQHGFKLTAIAMWTYTTTKKTPKMY